MNKKIISFVLCLTLLFGNLLPIASAEESNVLSTDDVFVENTESVTEPAETEAVTEPVDTTVPAETVVETQPQSTEAVEEETTAPETTVPETDVFEAPACDCGSQSALIIGHSDVCAMKQFYKELCAGTASDIYALWNEIPKNAQAYIMTYLGYAQPEILKELVFLLASKWESESGLSGVASAIKDGTLFGAFGIPEDAVLQIKEAAAEAKTAIEAFVAQQENIGKELFTWDISVLNGEGISWQPDGSVRVELELPGEKLHKHTQVYVVHVDDEGNAEKIEAEVIDGNKIAFNTKGFSTFAGYTVDFEYNGVPFSIPGGSEILLSDLMDQLKMPFEVADVADVAFTNYDLIAIEKLDGDWKLTSLAAFQTEEALTLSMNDGKVYEIKVTDETRPTLTHGLGSDNLDYGTAGSVEWYLTSTGTGYCWASNGSDVADGWTEDYDIIIDGTKATNKQFEIVLQRDADATGRTLYVDMHTLWIKGGAQVTFRLGASIKKSNTDTVVVRQVRGYRYNSTSNQWWFGELFWVENGSLEIKVPYTEDHPEPDWRFQEGVRIKINVDTDNINNPSGNGPKALVSLRSGATSFKAYRCDFRNARTSAIVVRADALTEFNMTDCTFDSSCYSTGNGGAIYVRETTEDNTSSATYPAVDVVTMTLDNVDFTGTHAASHGGAINIRGRVGTLSFTDCDFNGTYLTSTTESGHGGAIAINNGGSPTMVTKSLSLTNCTFTDTKLSSTDYTGRGGAIHMNLTTYQTATPITINGCTFTRCIAGSNGGAVSAQGAIGNFKIENGTLFDGCQALGARGGAVSVACVKMGDITLSGSTFKNNVAGSLGGALHFGIDDAVNDNGTPQDYSDDYLKAGPVDGGAVSVTGCTFTNNYSKGGIGGGICFTDGSYDSVSFTSTSFTDCYSANFGGAIALKAYAEDRVNLLPFSVDGDVKIEKCTFTRCGSGGLSPEPWDHDNNPNTAMVTTWDHDGDPNTAEILRLNGTGGGGAICIGGVIGGKLSITGESASKPSKFINCYTWNNGGAISLLGHVKTDEALLQYLEIDGCRARDAGGAVHLSNLIIDDFDFYDNVVKNCNYFTADFDDQEWTETSTKFYLPDVARNDTYYKQLGDDTFAAYDASGTFRCIGDTTTVAEIKNCEFTTNHSYSNGGGVYWNANNVRTGAAGSTIKPSLKVVGTTFTGNTALRDGGGLYCEATVDIDDCDFTQNVVDGRGGAIAQQVYNNEARTLGSTGSDEATNLVLDSACNIYKNTATHGGGISITVSDSVSIPDAEHGLATFTYPVKFQLGGASVYENYARENGGGIYYSTTAYADAEIQKRVDKFEKEILIDSGNIHDNIAGNTALTSNSAPGGDGGGIYMFSNQVNLTDPAVAGVKYGYSTINITSGSIYSNQAIKGFGGGIYMEGKNALCTITGGTIGGGTYTANSDGTATIKTSTPNKAIRKNSLGGSGGGIAIAGGATINMTGGEISFNNAERYDGGISNCMGGGIWLAANNDDAPNHMILNGGTVLLNSTVGGNSGNGGGIFVGERNKLTFMNGDVIYNTCGSAWGGGISARKSELIISGGNISYNSAGCGGGIMLDSGYSSLSFTGGQIYHNTATQNGGGLAATFNANVTVDGGNILNNTAGQNGGGVWGSYLKMDFKNGDIKQNECSDKTNTDNGYGYGGGIYAENVSNITVSGGGVIDNDAKFGGGIYATYSSVTVNNGGVTQNYAANGGGIYAISNATVTISGGDIANNEANYYFVTGGQASFGCGGGVYCNGATVIIKKDATTNTVGAVSDNLAIKGGGVFVYNGGDLTVNEGFVIHNTAQVASTSNTALDATLYTHGVGGGIFVAEGTSDNTSTFKMEGTDIAIYGNIADFAADDVFANGNFTKLDIPLVEDMKLSGHTFKPDDWFEDYPVNDVNYSQGLNGAAEGKGIGDGAVWRYRGSPTDKRVTVDAVGGVLAANTANTYVCMTLGAAAALPDTIVVDYGLPVEIDVLVNDLVIDTSNGSNLKVGANLDYFKNPDEIYKDTTIVTGFGNSVSSTYGDVEVSGTTIKYTPNKIINGIDTFAYAVRYNSVYYYAAINVIPATTVYYEDSFVTYKSYKYEKGNSSTRVEDASNVWAATSNATLPDQSEDRPGVTDLAGIDADNIYGYDGAYSNMATYSQGAAMKFTAKQTTSGGKTYLSYGTAEFTFTGTGFDVISLTDNTTGVITVQVYKNSGLTAVRPVPSTVTAVKTSLVDTYYGYQYVDGKWSPVTTTGQPSTKLYQVPVIKVSGLEFDTYTAVITVSYLDFFDHNTNDTAYDFYLDAIRIYDPANDGAGNQVIQDAYVADNEGWPEYIELRNLLLSRSNFDNVESDEPNAKDGIVFIDGRNEISNGTIADYKNYGPNNELYLAPGQSIAFNFALPYWDTPKVASVQIGLKSVGGSAMVTCYGVAENVGYNISVFDKKTINTATDMYYDITPLLGRDIVITNPNVAGNAILSITNIKVTYKEAHTDYIEKGYFPVTKSMATFALRSINQYYADLQAQMSVDLIGATLSFEDEVYTNLYYTTTSLDGAAESDMGLLTWSSMPEDATFENAENVFEGAVYNADNGRYMVRTDGIASKNLGDDIYMRPYVKLSTGSYVYGDLITYSPKQYAMSRLENSSNEKLKALCVAMLNYGAAAQTYFGYKTDVLANADLTAEQQALVSAYSADLFRGAIGANAAKVGEFAKTETGFGTKYASVSFESAFAINYYFAPTAAVDSDVTMYYWTADAYASADTLTAENASGALTMVSDGSGNYWAQISGIAAKQLDETYYVAAVYTSNGETFCTGVIAYSLSGYCMRNANGNMGELAQATAMYGYYALKYFG